MVNQACGIIAVYLVCICITGSFLIDTHAIHRLPNLTLGVTLHGSCFVRLLLMGGIELTIWWQYDQVTSQFDNLRRVACERKVWQMQSSAFHPVRQCQTCMWKMMYGYHTNIKYCYFSVPTATNKLVGWVISRTTSHRTSYHIHPPTHKHTYYEPAYPCVSLCSLTSYCYQPIIT